jgi:DNA-binding MarR family transcriptional regulator
MTGKLGREINQKKPFNSVQEEAVLSIVRTADLVSLPMNEVLRSVDLSPSQYNILRILRGAGEQGLPCGEIGERMVRRDPDVTRLLDRLVKRGVVQRLRDETDRRIVRASISREGLALLESLDHPVVDTLKQSLSHMSQQKLRQLIELLEELRRG